MPQRFRLSSTVIPSGINKVLNSSQTVGQLLDLCDYAAVAVVTAW
jgi:hypothetical protein